MAARNLLGNLLSTNLLVRSESWPPYSRLVSDEQVRKRLRVEGRAARNGLAAEHRLAAERSILGHLAAIPAVARAVCLGLSRADDGEPDLAGDTSLIAGRLCALPVPVDGSVGEIEFHQWSAGDELMAGRYGIQVPVVVAPADPDVVLVPLVAFDPDSNRIGRGAGYYDRWLATHHVTAIGVAFECQRVDAVPTLDHDVALDVVVTELGIRWAPLQ